MIKNRQMTADIKFLVLIILFGLFQISIFGQERVMTHDVIIGDLEIPRAERLIEKVYVHTDRDVYITGEDLMFSIYLVDGKYTGLPGRSRVAYIEIVNPFDIPVAQKRVGIYDAYAFGILSVPDTLTSGDYILRAYTNSMRNYGPDTFFSQMISIYNPFKNEIFNSITELVSVPEKVKPADSCITVSVGDRFNPREKASLKIQIDTTCFRSAALTNISISIAAFSGFKRHQKIEDYLSYMPELGKGNNFNTDRNNHNVYLTEEFGPYLEGTLLSRETLLPGKGELLYLLSPGKEPEFQYSVTDDYGNFRFLLPPYEESRVIIIQVAGFTERWMIKVNSPYSDQFSGIKTKFSGWDNDFLDKVSKWGVNYQICEIYDTINQTRSVIKHEFTRPLRFYGKPDKEIIMADYISLPTMEEVFRELVPGVSLKRQKTSYHFVISNEITGENIAIPGAVLLDGVILKDPSVIALLDPDLIERIDVIKGEYQVGSVVFNSLISIISKKGDMCGIEQAASGLRTLYPFLDKVEVTDNFKYPGTRTIDSRIPDFRNTLYWGPYLHPDTAGYLKVEFFTSDFLSDYKVVVEGLTDTGKPFSYTKIIKVEDD